MRALKIDVKERKIYSVDYDGKLLSMYRLIDCNLVESPMDYPNGDALFCDEEALLNQDKIIGGFMFPGWSYPIVGNGLFCGGDNEGKTISSKTRTSDLQDIIWISKEDCLKHARNAIGDTGSYTDITPPETYLFDGI